VFEIWEAARAAAVGKIRSLPMRRYKNAPEF
jgi:hypothetical protein